MNATIADLHRLDPASIGLSDYGRTGDYFERQIRRWSRQYREDEAAGRDGNMDNLVDWLPRHVPPIAAEDSCIVHGDFRVDNLVFHADEPRVLAVLDWELSTLGHPLADFSYHLMMYHLPPHIVGSLGGKNLAALGIPLEGDYVAAYCRRTGRAVIDNMNFYLAFNMFRLAAILHGIRGRIARGTASNDNARAMAQHVELLAELAWARARAHGESGYA